MGRKFGMRWKYATPEEAYAAKKRQEAAWNAKQRIARAEERAQKHKEPLLHTLLEREHAMGATRTITASLCGDPLPGRSALDRR